MSVYTDVLNAVVGLINDTKPYSKVIIGSLPPQRNFNSLGFSSNNEFFTKRSAVEMTAVLNGKHEKQKTVADGLGAIHTSLSMRKQYPTADNFQITNISTLSAPTYLGREENKEWLYGSSLRVKFFLKGD